MADKNIPSDRLQIKPGFGKSTFSLEPEDGELTAVHNNREFGQLSLPSEGASILTTVETADPKTEWSNVIIVRPLTPPGSQDDSTAGFSIGDYIFVQLIRTLFVCVNNAVADASWKVCHGPKFTSDPNDPTILDDSSEGYEIGSGWFQSVSKRLFICTSAALNTARWVPLVIAGTQASMTMLEISNDPENSIDLIGRRERTTGGVVSDGDALLAFEAQARTANGIIPVARLVSRVDTSEDPVSETACPATFIIERSVDGAWEPALSISPRGSISTNSATVAAWGQGIGDTFVVTTIPQTVGMNTIYEDTRGEVTANDGGFIWESKTQQRVFIQVSMIVDDVSPFSDANIPPTLPDNRKHHQLSMSFAGAFSDDPVIVQNYTTSNQTFMVEMVSAIANVGDTVQLRYWNPDIDTAYLSANPGTVSIRNAKVLVLTYFS